MSMDIKCAWCSKTKAPSDFQAYKRDHPQASQRVCRECINAYQRKRYADKGGYAGMIERHRLRNYGLTPADFSALIANQRGGCAVCRRPLDFTIRSGCHIDKRSPPALLCGGCNHTIKHIRKVGCLQRLNEYET